MTSSERLKQYGLDNRLLELPFDQFSRQLLAKVIVEQRRGRRKKLKILDVGGLGGKTRQFFPADEVTVVDLPQAPDEPEYVSASALDLPFKVGAYDAVLSFDVLEHIAGSDRSKFIAETARVSRELVVLAAPFEDGGSVHRAEDRLNRYYKRLTGEDHRWLREHLEYGLPELAQVQSAYKKQGLEPASVATNSLTDWEQMQTLIFLLVYAVTSGLSEKAFRKFNSTQPLVTTQPAYRRVLAAAKKPAITQAELEGWFVGEPKPRTGSVRDLVFNTIGELTAHLRAETKLIERERAGFKQGIDALLTEQDRLIKSYQAEISAITSSKAWRLANGLRNLKHLGRR